MKIVVDTNIVFSAMLNSQSRIGKILLNSKSDLRFFSCNYLKTEIRRHRSKLVKLTKLSEDELIELEKLVTDNITFIDERLIPLQLLKKAEAQLQNIDPKDTFFVALSKHLDAKLWTGDMKLYNGLKSKRIKIAIQTSELSFLLNEFEKD